MGKQDAQMLKQNGFCCMIREEGTMIDIEPPPLPEG
jgi:hypothetical protein